MSSTDRQDSDADDSDGPDDEENEEEEEEEDSQAESGLSATPSVSASPQHFSSSSKEADVPPSALLAQMSISSVSLAPNPPESSDSAAETSLASRRSPAAFTASDCYTSDPESVHMMSPVSPCRQMSIDYPDVDGPVSPPVHSRSSRLLRVSPSHFCHSPDMNLKNPWIIHPFHFLSANKNPKTLM